MPQYNIIPLCWYDVTSSLYLDRQIEVRMVESGWREPTNINDIVVPLISISRIEINKDKGGRGATISGHFGWRGKKAAVTITGTINNGLLAGTISW